MSDPLGEFGPTNIQPGFAMARTPAIMSFFDSLSPAVFDELLTDPDAEPGDANGLPDASHPGILGSHLDIYLSDILQVGDCGPSLLNSIYLESVPAADGGRRFRDVLKRGYSLLDDIPEAANVSGSGSPYGLDTILYRHTLREINFHEKFEEMGFPITSCDEQSAEVDEVTGIIKLVTIFEGSIEDPFKRYTVEVLFRATVNNSRGQPIKWLLRIRYIVENAEEILDEDETEEVIGADDADEIKDALDEEEDPEHFHHVLVRSVSFNAQNFRIDGGDVVSVDGVVDPICEFTFRFHFIESYGFRRVFG